MDPLTLLRLLGINPAPQAGTPPFLPGEEPTPPAPPPQRPPSRIRGVLSDMLQGAIAAGAQPGTGDTTRDIFRSLQVGQAAPIQRDMALAKMAEQRAKLAHEQAQAEWLSKYRPELETAKLGQGNVRLDQGQQRLDISGAALNQKGDLAEKTLKEKEAARKQGGILGGIKAQTGAAASGLDVPMNPYEKALGLDPGSVPIVAPTAKENLPEPVKAKVAATEAATAKSQADTAKSKSDAEMVDFPAEIATAMRVPSLAGTKIQRRELIGMVKSNAATMEANGRAKEALAMRKYAADLAAQTRKEVATTRGGADSDTPSAIAKAIMDGIQPPDMKGLYRFGAPVRGELAKAGYDLTTAQRDWQAITRHLSTLNGPQQERLRQAITFTNDSLDQIENLYGEWKKESVTFPAGLKVLNRMNLAAAKQLPGNAGAVAQSLEAQINDLVSELATVYKGGNSSTDESLRLAMENLKADWNEETFNKAIGQIRKNLAIRRNSIMTSQPVGVSPGSRYVQPQPPQAGPSTAPVIQRSPSTGKTRYSLDGGKTWNPGLPPSR